MNKQENIIATLQSTVFDVTAKCSVPFIQQGEQYYLVSVKDYITSANLVLAITLDFRFVILKKDAMLSTLFSYNSEVGLQEPELSKFITKFNNISNPVSQFINTKIIMK